MTLEELDKIYFENERLQGQLRNGIALAERDNQFQILSRLKRIAERAKKRAARRLELILEKDI